MSEIVRITLPAEILDVANFTSGTTHTLYDSQSNSFGGGMEVQANLSLLHVLMLHDEAVTLLGDLKAEPSDAYVTVFTETFASPSPGSTPSSFDFDITGTNLFRVRLSVGGTDLGQWYPRLDLTDQLQVTA